jgi:hypothetical protein
MEFVAALRNAAYSGCVTEIPVYFRSTIRCVDNCNREPSVNIGTGLSYGPWGDSELVQLTRHVCTLSLNLATALVVLLRAAIWHCPIPYQLLCISLAIFFNKKHFYITYLLLMFCVCLNFMFVVRMNVLMKRPMKVSLLDC